MTESDAFRRAALGAAAGLAGTAVLHLLLKANEKVAPQSLPPVRQDPGRFMINQTKRIMPAPVRRNIPDKAESFVAGALHLGYGATFGALYGLTRRHVRSSLLEGAILGIATWAAGYLGWLPATGLMPPIWKHKTKQIVAPTAEHVVYGMATAAAYDWMLEQ